MHNTADLEMATKTRRESVHRSQICPIYEKIFHYSRVFGIIPYYFKPDTLELIPVKSGFSYYLFLFNVCYLLVTATKVLALFLRNWWTRFELEEIGGGYFMQLSFLMGYILLLAMISGYAFNKSRFTSTVSSCIHLEEHILRGKIAENSK